MAPSVALLKRPHQELSTRSSTRQAAFGGRPDLTPEFVRFGIWGPEIRVARDGAILKLARWIATNDERHLDADTLWQRCQQQNPTLFRTYRIANLDAPSFFLPRGEVVFRVEVNPSQIPECPPEGVLMRHVEALEAFPQATTFLLQPVFVSDPATRLYSAADLRLEALGDRHEAMRLARYFGWAFRTAAATRRAARRAGRGALRAATRLIERLSVDLASPRPMSHRADMLDDDLFWSTHRTLTQLQKQAEEQGWEEDVVRFREALGRLREIDPVLCFELPERPGELWFESHWFEGIDGRRYVHY